MQEGGACVFLRERQTGRSGQHRAIGTNFRGQDIIFKIKARIRSHSVEFLVYESSVFLSLKCELKLNLMFDYML